jgi:peroxiredoxin
MPLAVFFYKYTCPVCQLSAPAVTKFEKAYPGLIFGVGQDPPPKLSEFAETFGLGFPSTHDLDPFPASTKYGIETVPTLFLIGSRRTIEDVVVGWDRVGMNRLSRRMAEMAGKEYAEISIVGDGLPDFRPG